jgi:glucokinase
MLDILTVGVSVRKGADARPHLGRADAIALDEAAPVQPRPGAKATGPGVSSAGALAHMSSHPVRRA